VRKKKKKKRKGKERRERPKRNIKKEKKRDTFVTLFKNSRQIYFAVLIDNGMKCFFYDFPSLNILVKSERWIIYWEYYECPCALNPNYIALERLCARAHNVGCLNSYAQSSGYAHQRMCARSLLVCARGRCLGR
jgi:hypothetical protein